MTLPWGYGKSKKTDGSRMGDEGRLYHESGKEHSGACGILYHRLQSNCEGILPDRELRLRVYH